MNRPWLRPLPVAAGALLVAGAALVAVSSVSEETADAYGRSLRSLAALDASLNEEVLRLRSNLATDYDALTGALADLRRLHAGIADVPTYLGARARAAVAARITRSRDLLTEKEELVEQFKSETSILRNSIRFAPVEAARLADRLEDRGERRLAAAVMRLDADVLRYDVTSDGALLPRIASGVRELRAEADRRGATTEVAVLVRHVEVIVEHKPLADGVATGLLGLATRGAAADLDATYSRELASALATAGRERVLAFACLMLGLIAAAADIIDGQRRSAAILRDATRDLENALAAVRIEQARERELGELKSRFIALASHEFRTPLSVILSSTDLVEAFDGRPAEERTPHFRRITRAVKEMVEMLDSILLVSKAEAGKLEVRRGSVDVPTFCADLAASLELGTRGRPRIAFTVTGDWSGARMDESHLRHALGNLLSNALKYSPDGGPVRFRAKAEGDEGIFEVEDEGIGIARADIARLFESFHRGSNVAGIPGTGLGLSIVKHSVEACGGSIAVESERGKGSRFVVRLPLAREVREVREVEEPR